MEKRYKTTHSKTMKMCRCTGRWWDSTGPVHLQHSMIFQYSDSTCTLNNHLQNPRNQHLGRTQPMEHTSGTLPTSKLASIKVYKNSELRKRRRDKMDTWLLASGPNPGKTVKPDRQPAVCSLWRLDGWFSQLYFVFLNHDFLGKFISIHLQVLF